MQIIDLFSGIGGFSLAGAWAGWYTVQFCEIDSFCRKILKYYWKNVPIHNDIKTLTGEQIINNGLYDTDEITILTGGFPCQPYSQAGKRKGKDDDRHLWPEMLRIIREIKPEWVVGENVFGIVNWSRGLVFEEVQADMEAEGYEVQSYILPAAGVNAPHRRDRVWFIAHSINSRYRNNERKNKKENSIQKINRKTLRAGMPDRTDTNIITNTNSSIGRKRRMHQIKPETAEKYTGSFNSRFNWWQTWDNFPSQPPICSGDDGISIRLDGITFPEWRRESIRALGNAIVPQVAYLIFKSIDNYIKSIY